MIDYFFLFIDQKCWLGRHGNYILNDSELFKLQLGERSMFYIGLSSRCI